MMRRIILISVCFATVVALSGRFAWGQTKGSEKAPLAIHYMGTAKPIRLDREALQTFKVKTVEPLSEQQLASLTEKLFSHAGTSMSKNTEGVSKEEERVFFHNEKDASASFSINLRTHEFLFNKGLAPYKGENDTPDLPKTEEAAALAMRHLKELDLLAPADEVVLAHVGGVNMGVHREDGTTSLYRKLVSVRLNRKLAGLPVLGNSRLVVQLAEKGSLTGLISRWPSVEGRKVAPGELRQEEEIRSSIEKRLVGEAGRAKNIVVKRTDLVLYDHGNGVIEPAIHVVASMHYEVPVINARTVGEVRRLDVPYDTFEPVLKDYKGRYPFMHDPNALRLIKTDERIPEEARPEAAPEKRQD